MRGKHHKSLEKTERQLQESNHLKDRTLIFGQRREGTPKDSSRNHGRDLKFQDLSSSSQLINNTGNVLPNKYDFLKFCNVRLEFYLLRYR